jgi:hypothetical protein
MKKDSTGNEYGNIGELDLLIHVAVNPEVWGAARRAAVLRIPVYNRGTKVVATLGTLMDAIRDNSRHGSQAYRLISFVREQYQLFKSVPYSDQMEYSDWLNDLAKDHDPDAHIVIAALREESLDNDYWQGLVKLTQILSLKEKLWAD